MRNKTKASHLSIVMQAVTKLISTQAISDKSSIKSIPDIVIITPDIVDILSVSGVEIWQH